jgi:hypothetical protein
LNIAKRIFNTASLSSLGILKSNIEKRVNKLSDIISLDLANPIATKPQVFEVYISNFPIQILLIGSRKYIASAENWVGRSG